MDISDNLQRVLSQMWFFYGFKGKINQRSCFSQLITNQITWNDFLKPVDVIVNSKIKTIRLAGNFFRFNLELSLLLFEVADALFGISNTVDITGVFPVDRSPFAFLLNRRNVAFCSGTQGLPTRKWLFFNTLRRKRRSPF